MIFSSKAAFAKQNSESVLFITLDSCRYDTFVAASCPNLKAIGKLHRAYAHGNFTYASHAAMFMGFTPGDPAQAAPYINSKFCKIFQLEAAGHSKRGGTPRFTVNGATLIDGFNQAGYFTLGSGAVGWFNPETLTGRHLMRDFQSFYYAPKTWMLKEQLSFLAKSLKAQTAEKVFLFLNIGETHVPYYYEGAPWSSEENPCVPFSPNNDAEKCRVRQRACLEYVDTMVAPLLEAFAAATTFICADHGDCWGEDGLWEHGISHQKTLEVPMLYRFPV